MDMLKNRPYSCVSVEVTHNPARHSLSDLYHCVSHQYILLLSCLQLLMLLCDIEHYVHVRPTFLTWLWYGLFVCYHW